MDQKVLIDYRNMFEYTKNTIDYMFVDKAEVIPGKEAWGQKLASIQDWYFKMHFPGDPVMPGALVMEAIMTTGSFAVYTLSGKKDIKLLFNECNNMKLFKSVRPGDILNTHAILEMYRRGVARFYGEAFTEGDIVCKMNFVLIAPEEFPKRREKV